jgi:hypothetical protein
VLLVEAAMASGSTTECARSPSLSNHDPYSSISLCRTTGTAAPTEKDAAPRVPTGPAAMSTGNKKRPRLDLEVARERKRGKSMFGILLGTLNKAKIEDKERNASEAVPIFFCFPFTLSEMLTTDTMFISTHRPKNDN